MDDNHVPLFAGGQGRSPRDVRDAARAIAFFLALAAMGVSALGVITWLR